MQMQPKNETRYFELVSLSPRDRASLIRFSAMTQCMKLQNGSMCRYMRIVYSIKKNKKRLLEIRATSINETQKTLCSAQFS